MGRTGRRRELGNKQKRKKDRTGLPSTLSLFSTGFLSPLLSLQEGAKICFPRAILLSLYSIFSFFPSISRIQNLLKFTRLLWRGRGGEGRFFKLFLFLFSLLLRPALTPLPQKRRIPFLLDRKQPPIGSESARVAKEEEEGKKEVSGASSSSYFSLAYNRACFMYSSRCESCVKACERRRARRKQPRAGKGTLYSFKVRFLCFFPFPSSIPPQAQAATDDAMTKKRTKRKFFPLPPSLRLLGNRRK